MGAGFWVAWGLGHLAAVPAAVLIVRWLQR